MRMLAIGDIHGCSKALDYLLCAIGPRKSDLIVTLGDYVDRGPDTSGVINRLIALRQKHTVVCLRGNHEMLMLSARDGYDRFTEWIHSGGQPTLASYAPPNQTPTLSQIPEDHWNFIERDCVDWHETDSHLFVHAGVDPDLSMEDQPAFVLQWERFHNPRPHSSGKTVVCGHTIQRNGHPKNFGHSICIDTGCWRNGWLTCYEASTGYIWQANQEGALRSGWVESFSDQAGIEVT